MILVCKILSNFRMLSLLMALAWLFLPPEYACGAETREEKHVLILFPNQSDLPAYPMVEKGIKSRLAAGTEFHIEYHIEFMDWYRNADKTYRQLLLDIYHNKFSRHRLNLVIACFVPSLNFATEYKERLFPQIPIVFSGIPQSQIEGLTLGSNVTGVLADVDYAGLLENALKIHPQTRHVVVVNGASRHDLFFEKEFRAELAPYAERIDFIYLTRLTMGQILEKVQHLPEHSVILFYVFTRDGAGRGFAPWEAVSMVAKAANAPVYGCLDSYFGHGVVGGRMFSMEMTGIKAGEMALRILRGTKPSDIPMTSQGTIIDMFDWRQFKRFKIREDRLPPDSIVRFKTYSFWELYRGYVVAAVVVVLLQSGLITYLLKQRAQRRRAQEKLSKRLRFEEMLAALSARFVNLPPDLLDKEIERVLGTISKILEVDRVSVYALADEGQDMHLLQTRKDDEVVSPPFELPAKQLPFIMETMSKGKTLVFSDTESLPAEAEPDKHFLRAQGVVAAAVIPLSAGESVMGMLSLAMTRRQKTWPRELLRQCRLVAEVFANALDRRRQEENLAQAEQKYRTVADFTYAWEYWANLDDSLEYVSPSCERISGYQTRDFLDNPTLLKKIILPEDRDLWDRHYHDSRQELKLCEIQFRIQRRDGQIRWIEHNCQPVTDPQGHLQGFRASNRDITVRKRVEAEIRKSEKDLRRLATQLISAHEEERRSLARELHDDLSQRLAALAIQAGRLEQQAVNEHAPDALACSVLKDRIIAISNDVHSLSRQLHPSILDDLGLPRAVESECTRFSNREGIEVAVTAENVPKTLPKDVSLSIYRIIQEGLNNIAKHACARRVEVALHKTDGKLSLSIQDDGIGFDAAEARQKPGLGFSSMRERVRIIHGVLRITSEPNKGTTISVQVPLEKPANTEATPADPE